MAWSDVSGVAVAELGAALAGLIRTDAPIDEKKKRRLIVVALSDVLVDNFVIFSSVVESASI